MNGNDVTEWEEKEHETLWENWCIKKGLATSNLANDYFVEKFILDNQEYWQWVQEMYSDAFAENQDRFNDLLREPEEGER